MPEPLAQTEVTELLQSALAQAESLQQRIAAGEEVDEKEITMLARMLATQMEEVRTHLETAFGPIDPELLKAQMKQTLSPEEYADWLAGEEERLKFRSEFASEAEIRDQLKEIG